MNLILVAPGVWQRHDEHSCGSSHLFEMLMRASSVTCFIAPLLMTDHKRINHINAKIVAAEISNQ